MITIKIYAGCTIDTAIALALDEADVSGASVRFEFNGHEVVVQPGEDPDAVRTRFAATVEEARRAWEESPAGWLHQEEAARRLAEAQRAAEAAETAFRALDLGDLAAVLRWISSAQPASDHLGSGFKSRDFATGLRAVGYVAGYGVGGDLSDRAEMARYLIGQALDGLEHVGAIHHIVAAWCDQWLAGETPGRKRHGA